MSLKNELKKAFVAQPRNENNNTHRTNYYQSTYVSKNNNELSMSDEIEYTFSTVLMGVKISGNIGQPPNGIIKLSQNSEGAIFINNNNEIQFRLLDYSWSGPLYNTISNSSTVGKTKGKTKRKGRLLGAVVGTVLLPGVGTVIGAAHGTGNKKHASTSQTDTITKDTNVEMAAPATIQLENLQTKEVLVISCDLKSQENGDLLSLRKVSNFYEQESPKITQSSDPYEEIKKAKELLDMGILTQEEFDLKKKELLGL